MNTLEDMTFQVYSVHYPYLHGGRNYSHHWTLFDLSVDSLTALEYCGIKESVARSTCVIVWQMIPQWFLLTFLKLISVVVWILSWSLLPTLKVPPMCYIQHAQEFWYDNPVFQMPSIQFSLKEPQSLSKDYVVCQKTQIQSLISNWTKREHKCVFVTWNLFTLDMSTALDLIPHHLSLRHWYEYYIIILKDGWNVENFIKIFTTH